MNNDWQRFSAIVLLAGLGIGIIIFLCFAANADGKFTVADGGLVAAAFLSIREVISKIEKVALGIRTPEASPAPDDE